MTIVAVLGTALIVVAIIVQLSSERYTGVAIMFLRKPTHIAVISFYIVASLCAVWPSVTLRPDFVPTSSEQEVGRLQARLNPFLVQLRRRSEV